MVLAAPPVKAQTQALPPVPDRVLAEARKAGHPFLMFSREGFQLVRQNMIRDFFNDRSKEFVERVTGYFNPDSPWFLGEGPLGEGKDFHPIRLSEADFATYIQILSETVAFAGIEKRDWAQNGLKREVTRILEDLQSGEEIPRPVLSAAPLTKRQTFLFAAGLLAYDCVYGRFDTIDRHAPNNQINGLRSRLSAYAAGVNPEDLEPGERLILGTALGLASLFCASIYQAEWAKNQPFPVQSLLPDLYRAAGLTQSGLHGLVSEDNRLLLALPELEPMLLVAIPWMECLTRMGYPYGLQEGFYGRIVRAFELLQLPAQFVMVQPYTPPRQHDPWIPRLVTLFPDVDPNMYPELQKDNQQKTAGVKPFVPFQSAAEVRSATGGEDRFQIPAAWQNRQIDINRGGKPISLREELERFGYPQKAPAPVWEATPEESAPDAGWKAPTGRPAPSVWGSVFLLAERDDPNSRGGELWEEYGMDRDSHPYTFFYYSEFPLTGFQSPRELVLSQYPEIQTSVLTTRTTQGDFLLASQAATAQLIMPTYAIDHESFLLADNSREWRWFHEIPSSTEAVSASPGDFPNSPKPARETVNPATPLNTSLFSCWTTYSPAGRTAIIRRHVGGVGSGYTLVAHFPDADPQAKQVEYVDFAIPGNGQGAGDPQTPGLYKVVPPNAQSGQQETMTFNQWQRQRRAERLSGEVTLPTGILNILFSPEAVRRAEASTGVLGGLLEAELADPRKPFFYILAVDQPGREVFKVKYPNIPLEGMRIIEWTQGIEMVAMKTGAGLKNVFLQTDADLAVVMRDRSMKGLFYLMVNGSYLQCKFSPTQPEYLLLADTKSRKLTAAWASRHLYTDQAPRSGSVFYAPELIGFECPGTVVKYGLKGRQAVVWENAPLTQR
ncbi:MAG: hypothetical protein ACE15F_18540 [bacterium]